MIFLIWPLTLRDIRIQQLNYGPWESSEHKKKSPFTARWPALLECIRKVCRQAQCEWHKDCPQTSHWTEVHKNFQAKIGKTQPLWLLLLFCLQHVFRSETLKMESTFQKKHWYTCRVWDCNLWDEVTLPKTKIAVAPQNRPSQKINGRTC